MKRIICYKNKVSYEDFIKSLNGKIITLKEASELKTIDKVYICLRHDIDGYFEHAVEFAEIEKEMGLKSTYFILPKRNFTDPKYPTLLTRLANTGMEIGLHNDILSTHFNQGLEIKDELEKELKILREYYPVVGTSGHGNRKLGNYHNINIWSDCNNHNKGDLSKIKRLALKDVGLKYEAYYVKRIAYLSDVGGKIKTKISDAWTNDIDEIIKYVNSLDKGTVQILTHPIHWDFI